MTPMDLQQMAAPAGALVGGVVTGFHCVSMCGPLTCAAFCARARAFSELSAAVAGYHLARVGAYALVGMLLGLAGAPVVGWLFGGAGRVVPWVLAAVLVAYGLGVERWVPAGLARLAGEWAGRLRLGGLAGDPVRAGVLLGLVSPLIPCGPLYLMFGVALVSGSGWAGGALMGAFGLGTVLVLGLFQVQYVWLQGRVPARWVRVFGRVLALVSAGVLCWRSWGSGGEGMLFGEGVKCH